MPRLVRLPMRLTRLVGLMGLMGLMGFARDLDPFDFRKTCDHCILLGDVFGSLLTSLRVTS